MEYDNGRPVISIRNHLNVDDMNALSECFGFGKVGEFIDFVEDQQRRHEQRQRDEFSRQERIRNQRRGMVFGSGRV